jgi:hypothetical protein
MPQGCRSNAAGRQALRNRSLIPNLTPAKTLDELERNISSVEQFQEICAQVDANRRRELAKPIPRDTCPGCFSPIYEGAAAQGWCCNCFPTRQSYESTL